MTILPRLPFRPLHGPPRVGAILLLACLLPACGSLRTTTAAAESASVPRIVERDLSGSGAPAAESGTRAPR